ncbi:ABC transporter ATP-binding protein [Tissierella praeacuta]|uniref:ABC transporter ATP-binding protein n=1 Tax=Tissierella praeacuta TaxID=43131 RepID=UPI001C120383|nr:energy-coupling factor ABC transporter ATP-binding protein [Tissierella praeacuta]MBU5255340.1 energy-coupling factor ABC transporter ATP-binding protein [Tissierella praeacuta]
MNVIELKNVSFTYQGMKDMILKHINLEVKKGEFILLTGQSGCGKTTLTRLINGLIPHFYPGELSGTALVNGKEIRDMPTYELAEMVGSVFQDPRSQFFTTNTISEIAFGCENMHLSSSEINKRVYDSFHSFQIEELSDVSIFRLSSGEKQKIALASVYAMKPTIFILDEPSANLDMYSTKMLGELLKDLKQRGNTIIISEHRLYYLMELIDRVIYMEDGELHQEWTSLQAMKLPSSQLVEKGLRVFDLNALTLPKSQLQTSSIVLPSFEAKDISVKFSGRTLLQQISFEVSSKDRQGIIGIVGSNGVGKTTLVKCLCGILPRQKGTVKINGHKLSNKKRAQEMYFVMQDTDYQLFTESVEDELYLGNNKVSNLDERISKVLHMLGLSNYRDKHPMALSGGQKQRVAIASAAVNSANVLFFDEPTSGLDGGNMRNVSRIFETLNQGGKLIFVISHDLEFLVNTCGRIIYLENGVITEDFLLTNQTTEKLKSLLTTSYNFLPLENKIKL